MPFTTSAAPTVKATLFALLQAAFASPVLVTYSNPGTTEKVSNVYLGNVNNGRNTYPVMRAARKKREEEFELEVMFEYFRGGDTALDAETQAYAAYGVFENMLANDPSLGLNATTEATLRAWIDHFQDHSTFDMTRNGWRSKVTATVKVELRLQ